MAQQRLHCGINKRLEDAQRNLKVHEKLYQE